MGYSTDFEGRINIDPPLNQSEIGYLTKFSYTRHMKRTQGPYFVENDPYNEDNTGVIHFNETPKSQPSLWCNFEPTEDGTALVWNGSEKTQYGKEWIEYLINYFLQANEYLVADACTYFKDFTFNHVCNGELIAQGEDPDDRWKIIVKDNVVTVKRGRVVFD